MHAWGSGQIHDEGLCHQVLYRDGERARATRAVASLAVDAEDCRDLLDQLGLRAEEGKRS